MANTSTATPHPASAVVDEAVRITADSARRATDSTQAALEASRRLVAQVNQVNRDLLGLWTAAARVGLQTTFDMHNAALASGQTLLDASSGLARQAQTTTLKTLESNAQFLVSFTAE